jgi:hypothetical protein
LKHAHSGLGLVFAAIICGGVLPHTARAATQCINQNAPNPIELCVSDGGRPSVFVLQPNGRKNQYYGNNSWGSVVWLNGTNTTFRYTTGYQGATLVTNVSNTRTGTGTSTDPWVITNITNLGATGVRMTQVFTYVNGDRTLRKTFTVTNTGASTFNDLRFFHGGDTFFGGDDSARSWYDSVNNMVYVTNTAFTNSGLMGFYANPATPSTRYFGGRYDIADAFASVTAQLPNTTDSNFVDAGYYLQWNRASLAPAESWSIYSHEIWSAPGALQVLAPANDYVLPGTTASRTFRVQNLTSGPLTVSWSAAATPDGWTVTLPDGGSAVVNGLAIVDVPVEITVPPGAAPAAIQDIALTATAPSYSGVGTTRLTVLQSDFTLLPSTLDFGAVSIGMTADLAVTLSNGASALPVQIGSVAGVNSLAAPFTIQSDTCSNSIIAASASCVVNVRFTPTTTAQVGDTFSFPILSPVITTQTISVQGSAPTGYTVTSSTGTGGGITPPSVVVNAGLTTAFTVTPNAGYGIAAVAGCGGSLAGNTYTTAAINSACAVSANFTLNSYVVSASAGVGGNVSPSSANVDHGGTTDFIVAPDAGYGIAAVTGCGGALVGNSYTTGAITGGCAVVATFVPYSYAVTASAGTGGSVAPGSANVNHGGSTSFTVTADTGYRITAVTGCSGLLTGGTYVTGPVTGACTVTATFSLNSYVVTASAGAHGAIAPGSVSIDHGASTSFVVTPESGYNISVISGCGGALAGNTYTTAAITGACAVSVSFNRSPPVFIPAIPPTITLNSTGLTTALPAGIAPAAVDLNGTALTVTQVDGQAEFLPGVYTLTWRAVDSRGVESTVHQTLNVWPIVSTGHDISLGYVAGNSGSFRIALNGPAPVYPFEVGYTVSGYLQGHDLVSGSTEFVDGEVEKNVYLAVTATAPAGTPEQRVIVELAPDGLNLGARHTLAITLLTANVAASVNVSGVQDGEPRPVFTRDGDPITLSVEILDPNSADTHTIEWSAPAGAVFTVVDGALIVEPGSLPAGVHRFVVTVTDHAAPPSRTSFPFDVVIADAPAALPDGSAGWAPSGLPIHPDYLPQTRNVLPERTRGLQSYLIEGDAGLQLALGSTALLQGLYQAELTGAALGSLTPDSVQNSGGMFDFEIRSLPRVGQSTSVVLAQRAPLDTQAVYRIYDPTTGRWSSFVAAAADALASAPSVDGACPPPASDAYRPGLNAGDRCVRLTLSDGGPNDTDGAANGKITQLGGVAGMNVVSISASGSGKRGGGAIDPLLLVFAALVLALRQVRRRWLLAAALAVALPVVGSAADSAGWYVGGEWGSARGDRSSREINAELTDLGYDAAVTFDDLSRSGWKLFGGYRFSDYVGAQFGYTNLGDVRSRIGGNIVDVDQLLLDVTRIHPHSASGVEAALTGRYPIASRFAATGLIGLLRWESTYRAANVLGDELARFEDSGTDLTFGFGIEYLLAAQWTLYASWNRYDVDGEKVSLAGVGASYRFSAR